MNAVIYARYSPGSKQSDLSIEGQLRDCHAFSVREGYSIVNEYIDRAITGRTDDRPAFQQMIDDAAAKQFEYIIVWKLDRFARNRYDSAMYKAKLRKFGVKVISATERISDDPEGIILEGMLESLAEYYSANLSKHVKRGMRDSALAGNFVGGVVPMGYKTELINPSDEKSKKRLVVDERTAHIVRYSFEQYAAGVSKKRIVEELNDKGYRTTLGKPFTINSFDRILRSKKYIGRYLHNGIEVAGGCPALIDEKLFYAVQDMLDKRKHAKALGTAREVYLLQGKAFCGYCGTRLVGDAGTSRNGTRHNYYSCGKRKKHRTCKKATEDKGFLEWYVVEQSLLYVLAPERIDYIVKEIIAAYRSEFNDNKVKELERQITRLEREVDKLVDASVEAPTGRRQKYFDKMDLLDAQRADIEIDLSRLRIANGIQYTEKQIQAWLKSLCKGDPLDKDFQRRIIDTFVNSVYLYDDKFVIYYNIKGGKQVSYIEMLDDVEGLTSGVDPPTGCECSDFGGNPPPVAKRFEAYASSRFAVFGRGTPSPIVLKNRTLKNRKQFLLDILVKFDIMGLR